MKFGRNPDKIALHSLRMEGTATLAAGADIFVLLIVRLEVERVQGFYA